MKKAFFVLVLALLPLLTAATSGWQWAVVRYNWFPKADTFGTAVTGILQFTSGEYAGYLEGETAFLDPNEADKAVFEVVLHIEPKRLDLSYTLCRKPPSPLSNPLLPPEVVQKPTRLEKIPSRWGGPFGRKDLWSRSGPRHPCAQ